MLLISCKLTHCKYRSNATIVSNSLFFINLIKQIIFYLLPKVALWRESSNTEYHDRVNYGLEFDIVNRVF